MSILVGLRYSHQNATMGAGAILDFLADTVSSMSAYSIMLLFLFYGTAISFNIVRQASSFWPVINIGEKLRLVILPLIILIFNLYICGLITASFS